MTSVIHNLLYIGVGIFIGLPLGWTLNAMRYAKQARDTAYELKHKLNERGWYKHRLSLFVVVIFTAVAAIWTGVVNVQFKESKTCTEKTITSLVLALQERTSLSTDLSIADSEQNRAFSDLMQAVLAQPQPNPDKMRIIFQDYFSKLNTYLDLLDQQRIAQKSHPLPKEIDYRKCLDGE